MASNPPYVPRAGKGPANLAGQRYRRNRRSEIAIWWREVDKLLLGLVLFLMAIGTIAVAAGSPASAQRNSTAHQTLNGLHFFWPHVKFQIVGIAVMLAASFLPRDLARRLAIMLGFAMLIGLVLVLVPGVGVVKNGARRWLNLGMSLQPSEFLKPAYAIAMAWIISWRVRDPHLPVLVTSTTLMCVVAGLLMLQPDFGSAVLFVGVWAVLMLMAGIDVRKIAGLAGFGISALLAVYLLYDNARHRIDAFLGGGSAFDQVDLARRTLLSGGWTGTGLWMGQRKFGLPEAHTDYIFSVIGEEFGLLWCAVIVMLYLAFVFRVLMRVRDEEDLFTALAAAGLATQLGGQAFINIMVNLQLFPSKGMTLPLISYGGSSTIALCLGVGFLLAITRRNPFIRREAFDQRIVKGIW